MHYPRGDPDGRWSNPLFSSLRRHRSRRSRGPLIVGLLVVVGAVGGGVWYWKHMHAASEGAGTVMSPIPTPSDTSASANVAASDTAGIGALPPLDSSDVLVRNVPGGLSSNPLVAAWLKTDDLVRRVVLAVANVAGGGSPTTRLGFLRPRGSFAVRTVDGRNVIDPASYRRYDGVTNAFVSLDTQAVARLYRHVEPLCEAAYRELGLGGGSFREALAQAFGELLAVRVPAGDVEVAPDGAVYKFADPDLEALSPAAKHLIRMGPANAAQVQEKLRALASAMGVQPAKR